MRMDLAWPSQNEEKRTLTNQDEISICKSSWFYDDCFLCVGIEEKKKKIQIGSDSFVAQKRNCL